MERRHSKNKPLVPFLVLCCLLFLLVPLASSAPMSRSLRLMTNQQQHTLSLNLLTHHRAAAWNRYDGGRAAAARMLVVEVNDYPPSGPNNRHSPPKPPGRA